MTDNTDDMLRCLVCGEIHLYWGEGLCHICDEEHPYNNPCTPGWEDRKTIAAQSKQISKQGARIAELEAERDQALACIAQRDDDVVRIRERAEAVEAQASKWEIRAETAINAGNVELTDDVIAQAAALQERVDALKGELAGAKDRASMYNKDMMAVREMRDEYWNRAEASEADRDRLREACEAFVEWWDADDELPSQQVLLEQVSRFVFGIKAALESGEGSEG